MITAHDALRIVPKAFDYGLDASNVYMEPDGTMEHNYPGIPDELPPHVAIWCEYDSWRCLDRFMLEKGVDFIPDFGVRVPDTDEVILIFKIK